MILQTLNEYYNILLNDPEKRIPKPGYSVAKVNYVATISKEGKLLDFTPLGDGDRNWVELIVPFQKDRTSNVFPYFLCDKTDYVIGWKYNSKKPKPSGKRFLAFKNLNEAVLGGVINSKSKAFLKFLNGWDIGACLNHQVIDGRVESLLKSKGGVIAFRLDGETGYLHEDKEIKSAWEKYEDSTYKEKWDTQCLVTGNNEVVLKTHPTISGVIGAQSAGARLVSVDKSSKAFESYQKTQGFNSPIGKSVVFGYTTSLNYMLSNPKHRTQIGETTTVFWAEDRGDLCENLLLELFAPEKKEKINKKVIPDPSTTAYVKDSIRCLKEGKPIKEKSDIIFYILGLSPNNARLSVRFWHRDSFGHLVQKIWQHHQDMQIINMRQEIIPISRILYETIPRNAIRKEASPILSGQLMKSVFTGTTYPHGLFYSIIKRIRADGEINDVRTGIIKAYLLRNARLQNDKTKEGMVTVALNEKNNNVAYRLGRLFAVLEKAQTDAAEVKLNTTIKDRYFGTASTSPRAVFPVLIKLTQHHISKAKYGYISDFNIQEILQGVEDFPTHLNSEEQGLFILGYYHQIPALYKKRENQKGEEKEDE